MARIRQSRQWPTALVRTSRFLARLAELTGGRSFSATNVDALDKVFERIDALEKSPVRGKILTRYEEHYGLCAGFAVVMLVLDRMLAMGRLRRLP